MPQRLTPLEVSLLALDTAHTPSHVGTVAVFDPGPDDFDYERLIALIRSRIAFAPRYRQRVRSVPGRLAPPVWVDDENFDLTFHVRRSALPRPGSLEQLRELVGRILARRLDRSRPLWEVYLVEGLAGGRFALVDKSHLSLVDGIDTVDLGQVLLEGEADLDPDDEAEPAEWNPAPEPTPLELVSGALWESAQDPVRALDNVRGLVTSSLGVAVVVGEVVGGFGGSVSDLARQALHGGRPAAASPLAGPVSEQRRFATFEVPLADLQAVRAAHGHTVNDVVLAAVSGALRAWLLTRGESVSSRDTLTALVPMSVTEDEGGGGSSLGSQVAPHLQSLPIGEPNALVRLHQVAYGTQAHVDTGRAVGARSLADIAGFAPSTLHALGVRASVETVRRQHDLLLTNVPGPQQPLFAAGARMTETYPVLPLAAGHLLSIGVTSYDGTVFVGLTADRDAIRDLDVLVLCLGDAVAELLDTIDGSATRQPTRQASPAARRAAAAKAAARREAATSKRAAGRKSPSTAAPAEKTTTKTAAAKKGAVKKATAKKPTAKKTAAKKTTAKATAKKATTSPRPAQPPAATRKAAGSSNGRGKPTEGES